MEEKELLEIEARERERAIENVKEMLQRKKLGDVWLLYRDRFTLERLRACLPGSLTITPSILIPIYDRVLVPVHPFHSNEEFERRMGYTVAQLMEWRKRGWVETLLSFSPVDYKDLKYLDDLIPVSPSLTSRNTMYMLAIARYADYYRQVREEAKNLLKDVTIPQFITEMFSDKELYRLSLIDAYVELSILKLTGIAKAARRLALTEPDKAAGLLWWSRAFLASPLLRALRQTSACSSDMRDIAERLWQIAKPSAETFFSPCWLADVYTNLGATIPQTMNTDEIDAVRKHSEDFVRALKSMDEEIDKAVKERFQGGELNRSEKEIILAKREEFRRRWYQDVVPTFKDITKTEKMWSITMTGSIVAPALALPAFTGVLGIPPALAALAAADKIKKLVDPAAEFLSTFFECNPIHLGFYKVQRELKKTRPNDGKNGTSLQSSD